MERPARGGVVRAAPRQAAGALRREDGVVARQDLAQLRGRVVGVAAARVRRERLDGRAHAVVRDGREALVQPRRRLPRQRVGLLRRREHDVDVARARLQDRALGGAAAAHGARRDDAQVAGSEAVVPRQQGRRALAAAARLLEAHDRPAVEAAREPRAPHARQREARVLEPLVGPLLEPLLRDALLLLALVRQEAEQPRRVLLLGVAALVVLCCSTAALGVQQHTLVVLLWRLEGVGDCEQCECFEMLVWHCATPACMHRSSLLCHTHLGHP